MYNERIELDKIKTLKEEKSILLKKVNSFNISKNEKHKLCERILDIKCFETEIQQKINFMRNMERILKK